MIDIVTFRQRIGTFQPNVKHRRLRISRIPSYRFNRAYTLCLVINFLVSSISDINWCSNHEPDLSKDFYEVELVQFHSKEVIIIANTISRFLHIILEQVSVSSLDPDLVKQPERTILGPQSSLRCQRQNLLNTHHQLFQEPMIKDMLGRLKEFHVKFLEKYS